jgi:hypothetical protein
VERGVERARNAILEVCTKSDIGKTFRAIIWARGKERHKVGALTALAVRRRSVDKGGNLVRPPPDHKARGHSRSVDLVVPSGGDGT